MKILKIATLAAATALSAQAVAAQERFITIGTGGQTGVYFVVSRSAVWSTVAQPNTT